MTASISRVSDSVLSTGEIVKISLHTTSTGKFYSLSRENGRIVTAIRKSSIASRLKALNPVSTYTGGLMGAMVMNIAWPTPIECLGFRAETREFLLRGDSGHVLSVPSLNCVPV